MKPFRGLSLSLLALLINLLTHYAKGTFSPLLRLKLLLNLTDSGSLSPHLLIKSFSLFYWYFSTFPHGTLHYRLFYSF